MVFLQCCNGCWSDRREDAIMLSTEIVELQIGLKNYDPQKDKRLSGSVKIGLMYALCVLFEDKEVWEDKEKTLEEYEKAKGVEKVSLKNSELPKVSGCKRIYVISQGADPVVASDGCGVINESDANLKTELKSDVEEEWMKLCPLELVKV
ncbi:60S ribosomal protein L10a-like [Papaver somniferum]|uniref:60S ribosomal protein L10a-like n=1 Tax=Papaver somniferum TaxID=3469 RepID=UPI000E7059E0|nr:60S ribosomal protein L10a-like [Papaver somniferum]